LFNQDVNVFKPATSILKASNGIWVLPQYLELTKSDLTSTFIGTQITGSSSGVTAFAEGFVRKLINGVIIDVLYISHPSGEFVTGELITNNTLLHNAPKIVGSLTNITITNGGENNNVGDLFNVSGTNGSGGVARIVSVVNGTGRVSFMLIDGGTGYSNTTTNIYVSNTVLVVNSITNSTVSPPAFIQNELVVQPLANIAYTTLGGANAFPVSSNVFIYASNGVLLSNGYVIQSTPSNTTAGSLMVSCSANTFATAANVNSTGNVIHSRVGSLAVQNASGVLIGSNSTAIGIIQVGNTFFANNAYIVGGASNTYGNVTQVSTGSGASFNIGLLSSTETLTLYTDTLTEYNSGNIQFITPAYFGPLGSSPSINLNANNSNVASGQFLQFISVSNSGTLYVNTNTLVFSGGGGSGASGNITTYANGSINYANVISAGNSYTSTPNIAITTSTGSGGVLVAQTAAGYGFTTKPTAGIWSLLSDVFTLNTFTSGTIASLVNINPGSSYNLPPFVYVINPLTAGYNRRNLILQVITSNFKFAVGDVVLQTLTGGTIAKGIITKIAPRTPVGQLIYLKVQTFNVFFQVNATITSQTISGVPHGMAYLIEVDQDISTPPMGENAIITSNVTTANGIASSIQLLDSGFGYQDQDSITLTNANNIYSIAAIANVTNQGIALGYWENDQGKLNSDMYLHDNYYYQEYSYEIQTGISIDKYSTILTDLFHTAGMQFFGKVIHNNQQSISLASPGSEVGIYNGLLYFDFTANSYTYGLLTVSDLSLISQWTFSRASQATKQVLSITMQIMCQDYHL